MSKQKPIKWRKYTGIDARSACSVGHVKEDSCGRYTAYSRCTESYVTPGGGTFESLNSNVKIPSFKTEVDAKQAVENAYKFHLKLYDGMQQWWV